MMYTVHNQENTQMPPVSFPCESMGSEYKTNAVLESWLNAEKALHDCVNYKSIKILRGSK